MIRNAMTNMMRVIPKSPCLGGLLCALVLIGGPSGCASSYTPARPLSESQLPLATARIILADSGSQMNSLFTWEGETPTRYLNGEWGDVSATTIVGKRRLEMRGTFTDKRGGTFVIKIPFEAPAIVVGHDSEHSVVQLDHPHHVAMKIYFKNSQAAKQFADSFRAMQDYAAKGALNDYDDPTAFAQVVERYRTASPKPSFSEEARKFKVRAEFAIEKRRYDDAIEAFGNALRVAPWWADGHFNRALLLSDLERYEEAALEMTHYLALEPEAKDARAAQDKIYQWENQATKQETLEKTGEISRKTEGRTPDVR